MRSMRRCGMRLPSSTSCAEGKSTNTNGAPLIDGTVVWSCGGPCEKPGGAIAPVDGGRAARPIWHSYIFSWRRETQCRRNAREPASDCCGEAQGDREMIVRTLSEIIG